jgi:hypothetical protein
MENPKDALISTTLSNAFIPRIVMNGLKASGLKAFAYDELLKRRIRSGVGAIFGDCGGFETVK